MPFDGLDYLAIGRIGIVHLRDPGPGASGDSLREELGAVLADGAIRDLVLDFSAVATFDAARRPLLVWLARELHRRGGRLALCGLPPALRAHPSLVAFGQVWMTITDEPDDAIAALKDGDDPGA